MESVSFHDKMKLPPYDISKLPNAVIQFCAGGPLGETNVYTQHKLQIIDKNWIVLPVDSPYKAKENKDDYIHYFFHRVLWIALFHDASPLPPNICE